METNKIGIPLCVKIVKNNIKNTKQQIKKETKKLLNNFIKLSLFENLYN